MRNKKLPDWAQVGTKLIYGIGYAGSDYRIETITRKTDTSVWTSRGDYAPESPNYRETRWVSDGSYNGDALERYGGLSYGNYTFARPLDSEWGRRVQYKAQKRQAQLKLRAAMDAWSREPNRENSQLVRQSMAQWEIKYLDD